MRASYGVLFGALVGGALVAAGALIARSFLMPAKPKPIPRAKKETPGPVDAPAPRDWNSNVGSTVPPPSYEDMIAQAKASLAGDEPDVEDLLRNFIAREPTQPHGTYMPGESEMPAWVNPNQI